MEEINKISLESSEYPKLLKGIKNPPPVLYIKGKIPPPPYFAIVGTRKYSNYGRKIALQIAENLAQLKITIVSGMAKGIDTFAHKGCLNGHGKTVAVLGTGVDEKSIYPKENLGLSRDIIKNEGAVISEFNPGTQGIPLNFPKRNRIISGLCLGVLVVEAKKKSGSLITARYAFEQDRKLFSIPGSIYSLNSQGTNYLIKRGAILVENADDILKNLDLPIKPYIKNFKTNSQF